MPQHLHPTHATWGTVVGKECAERCQGSMKTKVNDWKRKEMVKRSGTIYRHRCTAIRLVIEILAESHYLDNLRKDNALRGFQNESGVHGSSHQGRMCVAQTNLAEWPPALYTLECISAEPRRPVCSPGRRDCERLPGINCRIKLKERGRDMRRHYVPRFSPKIHFGTRRTTAGTHFQWHLQRNLFLMQRLPCLG
jgi:hypothetical protein